MLAEYFDHVYLINLPEREDRKKQALAECMKIGLTPEVFPAVNGVREDITFYNPYYIQEIAWNKGAAGLLKTTELILEDAKKNNYSSILILEDDIEFHPQINEVFEEYKDTIPEDWEIFQFGCCHYKQPEKISFRVFRIKKADCLHCYAINYGAYDFMLKQIRKMELPLDHITVRFMQTRGTSYCLYPNFAYQKPSYSNIAEKDVNYNFLKA